MKLETTKTSKDYKEYKGTDIPTKAEFLKRALKKASGELDVHEEWIEFIPAIFTLQIHGWFDEGSYGKGKKALTEIKRIVRISLKKKEDPLINLKHGKFHYDLRIKKKNSQTWFGFTTFRLPFTGIKEDKVMGTVKGYQSLVKGSKKLNKFLKEKAEKAMVTQGTSERRDKPKWLDIKEEYWSPPGLGTPTGQPGVMIAIEHKEPCVVHRRELDFLDTTFLGKYFSGRYFNRLVERKIKKGYDLAFYFWRANDCFNLDKMKKIAAGKIKIDPIEVINQDKYTIKQKPLKSKWKYTRDNKILKTK